MRVVFDNRGTRVGAALKARMLRRLSYTLGPFGIAVRRVVILVDHPPGSPGGMNTSCRVVARLAGRRTVEAEVYDAEPDQALARAAWRVARRLRDQLADERFPARGDPHPGMDRV